MNDPELLTYLETFISEGRKERILQVLSRRTRRITVAIEDVFQMHNASAVIRSCEVFGIQNAHLIEGNYGERLDKNIAMGAQKWVDLNRYEASGDCITALRKQGYQIVATTPHKESCSLNDFRPVNKIALFFGTEKDGLSDEVITAADELLRIPMEGFTESLNISVSAAVILQKLTSELRKSKLDWKLTTEEILKLRLDWTKNSIKSIDEILARYHGDT